MEEDIRSRSQISRFVPRDHGLVDTVNKICETLKWLLPNLIPSFHMVGGKNQHLKIVLWLPLLQHGIRILFLPNEYIVTFTKALRSICKFLFCKKNICFFTIFITQLDIQNSHLSSSMSGLVSTSYHTHHLCFSTISQIWHESHSKCSSLVWPPRPVKKPNFRLLPGPTLPATTHMYLLCCPHNPTWYLDFTHPSPRSSLVNIPAIFMHTFFIHTTHTFPTTWVS